MRIHTLLAATLLVATPTLAIAGTSTILPEPETLALLAIGAVALSIARWRRKK